MTLWNRLRTGIAAPGIAVDGLLARLIVVGVWGVTVGTLLVWAATGSQVKAAVGEETQLGAAAQLVRMFFFVFTAGLCGIAFVLRARSRQMRDLLVLVICLLPWLYLAVRGLYEGTLPAGTSMLYPVLVLGLWSLRPDRGVLGFVGILVAATLVLAQLLAVVNPFAGLQLSYTGEILQADKALLPFGMIAGMFTTANNLGQFAALGLPLVFAIRNIPLRTFAVVAALIALVWSSSRASWIAAAVALAVMAVLAFHRGRVRALVAAGCALGAALAVLATPLLVPDPSSFSGRGRIWIQSLEHLGDQLLFGLGPRWYQVIGEVGNTLGRDAYHAHNQFLHMLVTGGVVYVALVTAGLVVLWRAVSASVSRSVVPAGYVVALICMSLLEVTVGFVDRTDFWLVAVVPCLLLVLGRSVESSPTGGADADHATGAAAPQTSDRLRGPPGAAPTPVQGRAGSTAADG